MSYVCTRSVCLWSHVVGLFLCVMIGTVFLVTFESCTQSGLLHYDPTLLLASHTCHESHCAWVLVSKRSLRISDRVFGSQDLV